MDSLENRKFRWPVYPKLHMTEHLNDLNMVKNARFCPWAMCDFKYVRFDRGSTFLDEDLMGKLKLVCKGCHPRAFGVRAIAHYVVFLLLRWLGTGVLRDP